MTQSHHMNTPITWAQLCGCWVPRLICPVPNGPTLPCLGGSPWFLSACPCCIWTPETCPWTNPLPGVYRLQIQNFCFRQREARNPDQNGWEGNWEEKNEDKGTFLSGWTFCSALILTIGKLGRPGIHEIWASGARKRTPESSGIGRWLRDYLANI